MGRFIKIILLIILLVLLYLGSTIYHTHKKEKEFYDGLRTSRIYQDQEINIILNDFLKITAPNLKGQSVDIKLVDFPYVFDWYAYRYNEKTDISALNDAIGFAKGMNDDNRIEIYLNYKGWNKLNFIYKKRVLYHELCHDILNLNHSENSCNIMNASLTSCMIDNLDYNLLELKNNFNNQ